MIGKQFLKLILLVLLSGVPIMLFSKSKNEFLIYWDNYLLYNSGGLHSLTNNRTFANVSNTFCQDIGIKYTKILRSNILFSAGGEIGYERYATQIYFPFYEFGFIPTGNSPEKYELKATIPYVQVDLNVGYRYSKFKKIKPEIRVGHTLRAPLNSKKFRYDSYEPAVTGFMDINFSVNGYYGKPLSNTLALEMVDYVSAGVYFSTNKKGIDQFYLGMQCRKQLIFADNAFNYFRIEYTDVMKLKIDQDEFKGIHAAYSLIVGVTF